MPISLETRMPRPSCDFRPKNSRFLVECDFSKQYHYYYRKKLERARPLLEANCRRKWGDNIPICTLAEVANRNSDKCIVIGTIFKRMKSQPNVIDELNKGSFDISSGRYLGHYTSQDDTLTLEDDEELVQLVGKIEPKTIVTGVTLALLGSPIDNGGRFQVNDVCFLDPGQRVFHNSITSKKLDPLTSLGKTKPVYLLVVSGLGFHYDMGKNSKLTKALQGMIDFIWGEDKYCDDERSSSVARMLVVGDSLHEDGLSSQDDGGADIACKDEIVRTIKQSRQVKSIQAIKHMDDFFSQLVKTIDVDLMPGQSDPSSHLLPQQPFHPCMFPKSSMFPTFNCTTNPHQALYNGKEILASAGQNVDIISKFSNISDQIEVMKCHLKWGSTAPSAPDNLYSVPYENEDPFIIDAAPDIYIVGCQDSFRRDYYVWNADDQDSQGEVGTLLLTIPRFHQTLSCVLIDLESLETQLLTFG